MLVIRVLHYNVYRFPDKQTGAMIEGCSIQYIQPDKPETKEGRGGFEVIKGSVAYEIGSMLEKMPVDQWYFEASVGIKTFNGKAEVVIEALKPIPQTGGSKGGS